MMDFLPTDTSVSQNNDKNYFTLMPNLVGQISPKLQNSVAYSFDSVSYLQNLFVKMFYQDKFNNG